MQVNDVEELDPRRVDALLAEGGNLVIEFWGSWCGPCRAMAPILGVVSQRLSDRVVVGKIDIGSHVELASRFRVMSVPTFIRFEGGAEGARHNGPLSEDEFARFCTEDLVA